MFCRPTIIVPGKLQQNPISLLNTVCQHSHCISFVTHNIYFAHPIVMTVLTLQASQHIGTKQWLGPRRNPNLLCEIQSGLIWRRGNTPEKTSGSVYTVPIYLIIKLHGVTIQKNIILIFGTYKTFNLKLQTDVVSKSEALILWLEADLAFYATHCRSASTCDILTRNSICHDTRSIQTKFR